MARVSGGGLRWGLVETRSVHERRCLARGVVGLVVLGCPATAAAGMPSVTLSDLASARLSTLSFFLMLLVVSAGIIRTIWNSLRTDIPRLPRLSFGKALGVVTLWGLLFLLVLTMISGARELMTPGAWVRDGHLHRLADRPPAAADQPEPTLLERRCRKLERLRGALWGYAKAHDGRFPADDRPTPEVPAEVWELPDPSGLRYLYVPGRSPGQLGAVLAYEPGLFATESRLVLYADGEVLTLSVDALRRALAPEATPSAAAPSPGPVKPEGGR